MIFKDLEHLIVGTGCLQTVSTCSVLLSFCGLQYNEILRDEHALWHICEY